MRAAHSPQLFATVGDTITWVPTSKGHNVEFIAGPEGWDIPKKSKNNKEVSITFDVPGIYLYQCTPHIALGMIGVIQVGSPTNIDDVRNSVSSLESMIVMNKERVQQYLSQVN